MTPLAIERQVAPATSAHFCGSSVRAYKSPFGTREKSEQKANFIRVVNEPYRQVRSDKKFAVRRLVEPEKTYFRSLPTNKVNYIDKASTTPEHYNSTNAVSADCCLATAREPPKNRSLVRARWSHVGT